MRPIPFALALLALGAAACGTAQAERLAPTSVLTTAKSPYSIELIDENGGALDTYGHRGRFYVHGDSGERYSIRVSNPTDQRVEAVMSVDGLDVIDGETADFKSKRGYIVPAHGSLVIDGFRVSTQQVAAFRFSSVSSSYAGRKGKARNVGVVGVAIFTERANPTLVLPQPRPGNRRDGLKSRRPQVDFEDDRGGGQSSSASSSADRPSAEPSRSTRGAITRSRIRPPVPQEKTEERGGLGTAFGERRQSAVNFTRFVRANASKPAALAQLRYNNGAGLRALGIRLRTEAISDEEIAIRESANPFPESRFARPPR